MKQIKRIVPFFLSVLLLSASILIPVFLFTVQDKALLHGVKTEALAKTSASKSSVSILKRLELLCNKNKSGALMSGTKIKGADKTVPLENNYIQQILKELEKLQNRGGFPKFNLRNDLKFNSTTLGTVIYSSNKGWQLPVYELSFIASGVVFEIWADADTYTIYQYKVKGPKAILDTIDKQTVPEVFSDYLSISAKQFKHFYSFTKKGTVELNLKKSEDE